MENNDQQKKETYAYGFWKVKQGKAEEFICEWLTFANWTSKNIPGSGKAYLMKDKNDPLRFISCGAWNDDNSVQKWHISDEFKYFLKSARELCEDFQSDILKVVVKTD